MAGQPAQQTSWLRPLGRPRHVIGRHAHNAGCDRTKEAAPHPPRPQALLRQIPRNHNDIDGLAPREVRKRARVLDAGLRDVHPQPGRLLPQCLDSFETILAEGKAAIRVCLCRLAVASTMTRRRDICEQDFARPAALELGDPAHGCPRARGAAQRHEDAQRRMPKGPAEQPRRLASKQDWNGNIAGDPRGPKAG